jgi:glycosyl transferase family 1
VKKALFVDHAFHQKTRSSDFFLEIVRRGFDVEVYYLTPGELADVGVLSAAATADVVLLWQMDFLAPVFRAMGKPTIVIPMYDGSAGLPDLHWKFATGARFFNFSLRLNERIRLLGGETMLLRYFPAPARENELPRFDRLKAFFWQRRPDHGVHFKYIDSLIGAELDGFHLHNAPDVPGHFSRPASDRSYQFTESTWFKNASDYQECLASSNVFIAPRVAEGIGLALLEAMARGMLVLAHDAPTNNEYISNGINGILFNKDAQHDPIHIRDKAQRLGRMAWRTVVEGHQCWLDSYPSLLSWIDGAKAAPSIELKLEPFFRDLWYSYYGSLSEYQTFLRRHLGVLERLSSLPLAKALDLIGGAVVGNGVATNMRDCLLDGSGLLNLAIEGDHYTGAGWSPAEPEWRWAVGRTSELNFSGLKSSSERIRARFVASALRQLGKSVRCSITLNGTIVFNGRVTPGWKEYEFSFDAELLKPQNKMILTFDKAMSIPTDPRELSVCFKSFRFSADLAIGTPGGILSNLSPARTWRRLLNRIEDMAG